jgi:preprotein translocase subunit Sss1
MNYMMKIQKNMKIIFLISFFGLILLGCIVFMPGITFPKFSHIVSLNLQQILVMCVLCGVPGVLYWSKKKVASLKNIESVKKRIEEYRKIVLIRLLVFDILGLFTFFVHVFTDMNGALMLFYAIICLFMFIWPTEGRMIQETGFEEEVEKVDESENEPE